MTPLWIASQEGHTEIVELLINKGVAIDLVDKDGVTPLWIASDNGHKEIVKLLIGKGANANKVNLEGEECFRSSFIKRKSRSD